MGLLHIVRHPKCVLNELGRYQGRTSNSPFTLLGERQADALAKRLEGESLDVIFIPPQTLRHRLLAERINDARHTAQRVMITEDDRLREADYGAWECLTTNIEAKERHPEHWAAHQATSPVDGDFTFPGGGSSFVELRDQGRRFVESLDENRNVLVISSALTIRMMVAHLTQEDPGHVRQCALTTFESGRGGFRLIRLLEENFLPTT